MAEPKSGHQSEASRIAQFIGLPKWQAMDDLALVESIHRGFPAASARMVAKRVDPSGRFFLPTDIIPKSTLSRREKAKEPLTRVESEKIFALSKLFASVIGIYHGDLVRAAQFLRTPHPMLRNQAPMDVAKDSIAGAELVLKILAKADAGVAA